MLVWFSPDLIQFHLLMWQIVIGCTNFQIWKIFRSNFCADVSFPDLKLSWSQEKTSFLNFKRPIIFHATLSQLQASSPEGLLNIPLDDIKDRLNAMVFVYL